MKYTGIYIVIMNVAAFIAMGLDKRRAKRGVWRVRERTLFLLSLLGGSIGSLTGMYLFRHKTKHWYFVWGMPAILILHLILVYLCVSRL